MYMHPQKVLKGIGTRLLQFREPILSETESYCIPFDHLLGFYGKAGFKHIQHNQAPGFLAERIENYFKDGKKVVIMHRPAGVRA